MHFAAQTVAASDRGVLSTAGEQPGRQQQQQQFAPLAEGMLAAPLIIRRHLPPAAAALELVDSGTPVVNFKAFKRKQRHVAGWDQHHQRLQQQGCTAGVTLAAADVEYRGADADAFLK